MRDRAIERDQRYMLSAFAALLSGTDVCTMSAKPDEIAKQLEALDKSSFNDEASRTRVAEAAHSLFLRLESPYARFVRHGYTEVSSHFDVAEMALHVK